MTYENEHCENCIYFKYGDECVNPERKLEIQRDSEALHTEAWFNACERFVPHVECRIAMALEALLEAHK